MITTPRLAEERNRKTGRNVLKVTALFVSVVFSIPPITWAEEAVSVLPPGSLDGVQRLGQPTIEPPSEPAPTPLPKSPLGKQNKTSLEFLLEGDRSIIPTKKVEIEIPPVPEVTPAPEPLEPEPSNLSGGAVLHATPAEKKKKGEHKDRDNPKKTADENSPGHSWPGNNTGNLNDINVKDLKPLVDPKIEREKEDPLKVEGTRPEEIVPLENLVSRPERNHFLRSTAKDLIFAKETKRKRKNQRGHRGATVTSRRRHASFE